MSSLYAIQFVEMLGFCLKVKEFPKGPKDPIIRYLGLG